eukprot:scaffold31_cov263-Pinguiococcus_pyrenoidosus.AAC.33
MQKLSRHLPKQSPDWCSASSSRRRGQDKVLRGRDATSVAVSCTGKGSDLRPLRRSGATKGGAITAIVRAFGRHLQDRETVLVLLKLFRHVCFGVSGNVELAARNGGIVAVASCLRSHVDDEDIVAEAFWVLSVLGKHPGSEGVVARVRRYGADQSSMTVGLQPNFFGRETSSDIEAAAARHPEHPQIMAKGMYLAALAQGPSDEGGKDEAQASESAEAEGKA